MAAPRAHVFFNVKHLFLRYGKAGIKTRKASIGCRSLSTSHCYSKKAEPKAHKETHFGFEYVTEEEKEEKVYEVFENVAESYDLMNDTMSAGVHRLWKDYFVSRLGPVPGTKLIDVAGGTGDIAFRCLDYCKAGEDTGQDEHSEFDIEIPQELQAQVYMDPGDEESHVTQELANQSADSDKSDRTCSAGNQRQTHVTICDINQAMLDVGKKKSVQHGYVEGCDVAWLCGNAECLSLADDKFDGYTIAFGIRNVTHIDKVLDEAYRVLKPGGRFMCLEFSRVTNPLIRSLYDSYSFQVIPVMGQVIARDWKSYQYLVESIRQFPDQESFAEMIRKAGFKMVTYENLTFGVAAIHSGYKF